MFKSISNLLTIGLIIYILSSLGVGKFLLSEKSRLERNQTILVENHEKETRNLIFDKQELKKVISEDSLLNAAIIDSMNIKVSQLENLVISASKTKIQIKTVLKDTTVYVNDTIKGDTVIVYKSFNWEDAPWAIASGEVYTDSICLNMELSDTIYVANFWKREGTFPMKYFKRKKPHSDVTNANPYVNIHVEQTIKRR